MLSPNCRRESVAGSIKDPLASPPTTRLLHSPRTCASAKRAIGRAHASRTMVCNRQGLGRSTAGGTSRERTEYSLGSAGLWLAGLNETANFVIPIRLHARLDMNPPSRFVSVIATEPNGSGWRGAKPQPSRRRIRPRSVAPPRSAGEPAWRSRRGRRGRRAARVGSAKRKRLQASGRH